MKTRMSLLVISEIFALLFFIHRAFAWTGDTWGPESREQILRLATQMINLSWTPKEDINNQCSYSKATYPYYSGTPYKGEAYDRFNDPVEDWGEFYTDMNGISCQTPPCSTNYGTECAGFVSMAWQLPQRYNTTAFEDDAVSDGGYATMLGATGSGPSIANSLLPGDAFVDPGNHILLFDSLYYDPITHLNTGIWALEETQDLSTGVAWAVRDSRSWSFLSTYRPIRRNDIDEGNYQEIASWGSPGNLAGQFNYPYDITVDSSGNVYVADTLNYRVQKFTNDGYFTSSWETPWGDTLAPLAITADNGVNIFTIADEMVVKSDDYGNLAPNWNNWGYDASLGNWFSLSGAASDSSGNIYLTDSDAYDNSTACVDEFTNDGSFIQTFGTPGSGDGQLNEPWGIAIDMFGDVFVSDSYNNRIEKFDSYGNYVTAWGACCSPDGYFASPAGLAVDASGDVYVADSGNSRIQKFDANGTFLTAWGSDGTAEGQFQHPYSVAVDSNLNVFVADTENDRIQKFAPVSPYPSAPDNLTATPNSSTMTIYLSWNNTAGTVTGFTIERKEGISGTYNPLVTVLGSQTTYTDTVTTAGTYYYVVYADNGSYYSAYSTEASATITTPQANIVPAPSGDNSYTYSQISSPVLSPDPATAEPIAVANTTTSSPTSSSYSIMGNKVMKSASISDGTLTISVGFLPFSEPMDIYLGIYAPDIDPNVYLFLPDNTTQPESSGLVKWRENTVGPINEVVVDLPVSDFPPATYYFSAVLTPADDLTNYDLWTTSFVVTLPPCALSPVMITGTNPTYYSTLQDAYNVASDGAVFESQATNIAGIDFNRDINVTLQGGYDCGYSTPFSNTTITGSLTVSAGTLTLGKIIIK